MTKINLKTTENAVTYSDILLGEMFTWEDRLYLKIITKKDAATFNAVCISTRGLAEFYDTDAVRKVSRVDVFID